MLNPIKQCLRTVYNHLPAFPRVGNKIKAITAIALLAIAGKQISNWRRNSDNSDPLSIYEPVQFFANWKATNTTEHCMDSLWEFAKEAARQSKHACLDYSCYSTQLTQYYDPKTKTLTLNQPNLDGPVQITSDCTTSISATHPSAYLKIEGDLTNPVNGLDLSIGDTLGTNWYSFIKAWIDMGGLREKSGALSFGFRSYLPGLAHWFSSTLNYQVIKVEEDGTKHVKASLIAKSFLGLSSKELAKMNFQHGPKGLMLDASSIEVRDLLQLTRLSNALISDYAFMYPKKERHTYHVEANHDGREGAAWFSVKDHIDGSTNEIAKTPFKVRRNPKGEVNGVVLAIELNNFKAQVDSDLYFDSHDAMNSVNSTFSSPNQTGTPRYNYISTPDIIYNEYYNAAAQKICRGTVWRKQKNLWDTPSNTCMQVFLKDLSQFYKLT